MNALEQHKLRDVSATAACGFEIPIGFLAGGHEGDFAELKWRLYDELIKRRLSQITAGMIERFLYKLASKKTRYERKFSPVTIRMIYSRLNQVFSLAARERVFLENPLQVSESCNSQRIS